MPWNSIAPLGSVSVKANRTRVQQNTTYTELTMGNSIVGTNNNTVRDHFWNVGANEDGRHRFIQSPNFTSTAASPNNVFPVLGAGMNIMMVPLVSAGGSVEWWRKNIDSNTDNNNANWQITPRFIVGAVNITSSSTYVTLTTLPQNVWGEIFMFYDGDYSRSASGWFSSSTTITRGFSTRVRSDSGSQDEYAIELRNSGVTTLDLQARRGDSSSSLNGIWHYRIMYRGI
jgi:hypothetical protein